MSECTFCTVSAGRAERSVVYEDETSVAVMDISPVNPGHMLVIPKEHVTGLEDLTDDAGSHLFGIAERAGGWTAAPREELDRIASQIREALP